MIYETEKYIEVLTKLRITPSQFIFAWMIYNKQWELIKKYMNTFGSFDIDEIRDLMDKDVILNTNRNGKEINARDLMVTEIFANEMLVDADDAWEELKEKYPGKVRVNDTLFASKGLTFSDEKACAERYKQILKGNKYLHNTILALLEGWKNKNGGYATMKIDKFITSEYWKELETERDTHVGPALF